MKYTISAPQPHTGFIHIEARMTPPTPGPFELVFPAWRPGRYTLGNFAANIREWTITDSEDQPIPYTKVSNNTWQVEAAGQPEVVVRYTYYARQLDAGSTFVDEHQLYVNPVNCLVYVKALQQTACTLTIETEKDRQLAVGWPYTGVGPFQLAFPDFHTLVDTPFIASNDLQVHQFKEGEVEYFLWFQGECRPPWERLEKDFRAFIRPQVDLFGSLPVSTFHFLFQIRGQRAYHGVEHLRSTVILLGPGYEVFSKTLYPELLGVSSHELFHCWNVKTVRPQALTPYDYSQENFTTLGYVMEGVTTYYGDLMLMRAGLITPQNMLDEMAKHYQRHCDNGGRYFRSMADSSVETWLDGYHLGTPHRRLSIYSDGALLAFMADVQLLQTTNGKRSMDDVMRLLVERYANKGFTEQQYQALLEEVGQTSFEAYFTNFIKGKGGFENTVQDQFSALGWTLDKQPTTNYGETAWGIKTDAKGKVAQLHTEVEHRWHGLKRGDTIRAVNGIALEQNLHEWLRYFGTEQPVDLTVDDGRMVRTIRLEKAANESFYQQYKLAAKADHELYTAWKDRYSSKT